MDEAPATLRPDPASILVPGATCWRLARAGKARLLIDAAEYFGVLREVLLKARRQVLIAGWDVDGRTPLHGGRVPRDGAPGKLRRLLRYIAKRRPELDIRILLWDFPAVYVISREMSPTITLGWRMKGAAKLCLDDLVPAGGCHHQKIVVVDDSIAFCGGIDLAMGRWDTPAHDPDHPIIRRSSTEKKLPFHDLQMAVDGEAAVALGDLVRERWRRACGEPLQPIAERIAAWPDGLEPMFEEIDVGIARTVPALSAGEQTAREVEACFLRMIASAERLIYVENQYMTSRVICEALLARLREVPSLEVILLGPRQAMDWLEEAAMGAARTLFVARLRREFGGRVQLFHPYVHNRRGAEVPVTVHAKLMIVDDRVLRVGSANLNNRSMGFDTECDLVLEAQTAGQRERIAGIRDALLGEHLGVTAAEVPGLVAAAGGYLAAIGERGSGEPRGLRAIEDSVAVASDVLESVQATTDPDAPGDWQHVLRTPEPEEIDFQTYGKSGKGLVAGIVFAAILLLVVVLAVGGKFLEIDAGSARGLLEKVAEMPWTPAIMLAVYLVVGTLGFPITVLIATTAAVFGPFAGFAYGLAGSVISAMAGFFIGRAFGSGLLQRFSRGRIQRIGNGLKKRGVLSVAGIRMVPIAPFAVVNLVAGAIRLKASDFALGTFAGMMPGIAVLSSVGSGIAGIIEDPSPGNLALLALAVSAWLSLVFGVRLLMRRLLRR